MGDRFVLAGASLIDGTGARARVADVYVEGERIERVEPPSDRHPADWRVERGDGLVLSPGFIDVHSHADNQAFVAEDDTSKILQGVTTEVVGNCGISLAPRRAEPDPVLDAWHGLWFTAPAWPGRSFGDYWRAAAASGLVTNAAPLVGHGALRIAVMGLHARPATAAEMGALRDALARSLDDGAFGLSSGLIYPPGVFTPPAELAELATGLGDRVYASHIRGEGAALLDAVAEAIDVGRRAGVRVEISHHKSTGRENRGRTAQSLALVDAARADGVDVRLDVYPYTASSTTLAACLPPWMHEGGRAALADRLEDEALRARARRDLEEGSPGFDSHLRAAGPEGIVVASTADHRFEGESLAQVAARLGVDPIEALFHVLRAERAVATMIAFVMDEDDVRRVLAHPWATVGSDGLFPGTGGRPHPRMYGTFPRVLGRYVRDEGVLPLEGAVAKMTGRAADAFRIPDRGTVAPGKVADLVLWQAGRIADGATYEDPFAPPTGIEAVYLAGRRVVDGGAYMGGRHGAVLRPA